VSTSDPKQLQVDLQSLRIRRDSGSAGGNAPKRRRWLLPAASLLVLSAAALAAWQLGWLERLAPSRREVRVALATRTSPAGPAPVLSAGGYIIARHQVEVASKITGRVVEITVDEGDRVERGQVLARLDDAEVAAAVRQADAALDAARARLAELLAGSRPQEIERTRAEMERARADLENARLTLARTRQLVADAIIEQQALDDARARYEMAEHALQSAAQVHELARLGPRREEIDQARAQVAQAEATLAFEHAQQDNTVIRAPVSGTVLNRYVDPGEMVTTGFTSERGARQALVNLADMNDLQAELDIAEADIARVGLDLPVVITPDAYPSRHYPGRVEYIAPVGDRQKATIKVKVRVQRPDAFLRPDMGVKVAFFEGGEPDLGGSGGVRVPQAALARRDGRDLVFLVREGRAVQQPVSPGSVADGYVEIVRGLEGSERVILDPADIQDGQPVEIRRP